MIFSATIVGTVVPQCRHFQVEYTDPTSSVRSRLLAISAPQPEQTWTVLDMIGLQFSSLGSAAVHQKSTRRTVRYRFAPGFVTAPLAAEPKSRWYFARTPFV